MAHAHRSDTVEAANSLLARLSKDTQNYNRREIQMLVTVPTPLPSLGILPISFFVVYDTSMKEIMSLYCKQELLNIRASAPSFGRIKVVVIVARALGLTEQ
jgi:hypothetical protein